MNFIEKWLSLQIDLGSFDSRAAIWSFAAKMSFRAVILACIFSLAGLPLLYAFGILTLSVSEAVKLSVAFSWLFGGAVSGALALVTGGVIRDLAVSRAEFERLSQTDALSGLSNRRAFNDALDSVQGEASLAIIDIDRFKAINDRFGHHSGDMVIRGVSDILREVFHDCHVVARLGGEEFGVIICGGGIAQRLALVERARMLVAARGIDCQGQVVSVTISAGVAEFVVDRRSECVYARADNALYLAKGEGRDRVLHEQSMIFDDPRDVADETDYARAVFGAVPMRS
ncbi:GGDEF domain-containing protein [Rhizobium sp. SL42]|uniref:GGDEF domain-containing protein n=1 Tax=Rhizobium sp. SL42 TaxID=2806346 RepID=UPI001F25604B|nr:GGDEF domain-containing protein [Rhizobium sp. SL42]UJW74468.1 GGDEF domain-containing protein [Rhizobium sp. SL42]